MKGTMPEVILLDTSALLYWTLAPERLTSRAAAVVENAKHRMVLAVSLWEIALKNARGALELPLPMDEYLRRLEVAEGLEIQPLHAAIAVAGALLAWDHRDPADRWIVALAKHLDLPLVTSDERILSFYPAAVW